MSYYLVGDLIKKLRLQRSLTQSELAEGIISLTNLSRLENGLQLPHKEKLDSLLQRLGTNSQEICSYYLTERDFIIAEKKDRLQSCLTSGKYEEAKLLIEEMQKQDDYASGINLQFLMSCQVTIVLNHSDDYTGIREDVISALRLTIPCFTEKYISSYFLSDLEARLINILAITYFNQDNLDKAIEVMFTLKESLEQSRIDEKQKSKMFPIILYNLSKYLGLAKRFEEAIEICDFAINICLTTNNMRLLPSIIFNKAWDLCENGHPELVGDLFHQAYWGCSMFGKGKEAEIVKNYAREKTGIVLDNNY